jgi:hypothetical protein
MRTKAQGAIEYLLIIGAAVMVAAITIALITQTVPGQKDPRTMAKCAIKTACPECLTDTKNECIAIGANGAEYALPAGHAEPTPDPSEVEAGCAAIASAGDTFSHCTTAKTI